VVGNDDGTILGVDVIGLFVGRLDGRNDGCPVGTDGFEVGRDVG